jgi:hypothetical protein
MRRTTHRAVKTSGTGAKTSRETVRAHFTCAACLSAGRLDGVRFAAAPRATTLTFARRLPAPSFLLWFPLLAVIGFGGCPQKNVQPKFTQVGVLQPPLAAAKTTEATPPTLEAATAPDDDIIEFTIPTPRPPAVHHAAATPEAEPESAKPSVQAPQISPQLSPGDTEKARSTAEADIRTAQQNLNSAGSRRLNANQQDLAEKVKSFTKQAQEAMAASDWQRAQSLAEKARLLSIDLVRSF